MRCLAQSIISGLLSGLLVLVPTCAAQDQPIGVLLEAEKAHMRSTEMTAGASVYPGDLFGTDSLGHALMRINQTRFQLTADSTAAFFIGPKGPLTELRHGRLIVSSSSVAESFEIYVSDIRILPGSEVRPLLAEVTYDSPCEVRIDVEHGSLEVTSGKETKTIDEGHSYRVTPEVSVSALDSTALSPYDRDYHKSHTHANCAALPEHHMKLPTAAGLTHFNPYVLGGVVGLITIVAVHEALESPERP